MEIHDSWLQKVTRAGNAMIFQFEAYIHESNGEPGVDEGTGWIQPLAVELSNADVEGNIPHLPCDLSDGHMKLEGRRLENVIPIPLDRVGTVEIRLESKRGESLLVRGDSVKVTILGNARFIEEFHR
jgi:hypothetical protein